MITNETEYTDPFYNGSMDSTLDDVNHIGITLSGRKRKQDAAPDDTSNNAYEKITRRDVIQKAKDIAGKVLAIWFPIFAFVIGGFEHIVANMFYIPTGMLAATNPVYVAKAEELYGITGEQLNQLNLSGLLHNFIPVTIGNILGGMVFIGCILYFINVQCDKN